MQWSGAVVCLYTAGALHWQWECGGPCGQKSSRVCQCLGYTVGVGSCGSTVIPSPLNASPGVPAHKDCSKSEGRASKLLYRMFFLMDRELLMATMELKPPQQKKTMDLSKARIFCFIAKCLMQKIFAVARWDQPHSRTQFFFLQLCAKAHSCPIHFLLFYLFS